MSPSPTYPRPTQNSHRACTIGTGPPGPFWGRSPSLSWGWGSSETPEPSLWVVHTPGRGTGGGTHSSCPRVPQHLSHLKGRSPTSRTWGEGLPSPQGRHTWTPHTSHQAHRCSTQDTLLDTQLQNRTHTHLYPADHKQVPQAAEPTSGTQGSRESTTHTWDIPYSHSGHTQLTPGTHTYHT